MRHASLWLVFVFALVSLVMVPVGFAQQVSGDDLIRFMKPLEGIWTTTLKMGDDAPVPGKLRYELAANKRCYVTQMEGGGLPFINGLEGYDPVAKTWTGTGFADNGQMSTSTLEWTEMTPGAVLSKGSVGKSILKLFNADGTTVILVQTMKCEKLDHDSVVLVYTERTSDGAPAPNMVFTLQRKK